MSDIKKSIDGLKERLEYSRDVNSLKHLSILSIIENQQVQIEALQEALLSTKKQYPPDVLGLQSKETKDVKNFEDRRNEEFERQVDVFRGVKRGDNL